MIRRAGLRNLNAYYVAFGIFCTTISEKRLGVQRLVETMAMPFTLMSDCSWAEGHGAPFTSRLLLLHRPSNQGSGAEAVVWALHELLGATKVGWWGHRVESIFTLNLISGTLSLGRNSSPQEI